MGRRSYVYKIKRDMAERLKNMTYQQAIDSEFFGNCKSHLFFTNVPIYRICWLDRDVAFDARYNFGEKLFNNKEINEDLYYEDPYIIKNEKIKEFVEYIQKNDIFELDEINHLKSINSDNYYLLICSQ